MSVRRMALLSVSDKTGIVELGRALAESGWTLLSTGGTAAALRDAGLRVTDIAQATGHPEMMSGRVKTLHPAVHAGVMARRDRPDDLAALDEHGYRAIDLVVANLYPFREAVAGGGIAVGEAMEQVDIGGPAMIRAAAKNHRDVWVAVDPADYPRLVAALDGADSRREGEELRRELATKVFRHVSDYDAAIAAYLAAGQDTRLDGTPPQVRFGERLDLSLRRRQVLRYGENPDQEAAFYAYPGEAVGLAGLEQLQGKELSYNNYLDLDGALLCLGPFAHSPGAVVCIVKHTTPCGLAVGSVLLEAYKNALATDPVSAFGSVIALNRPLDGSTAEAMSGLFVECIVAPEFDDEARAVLAKKKNLRLLSYRNDAGHFLVEYGRRRHGFSYRSVYGGMLAQTTPEWPSYGEEDTAWRVVTRRSPESWELDDLRFAWAAAFGVKSNAIVLARGGATLGIGAGQMSRVDSSRLAVEKAADAGLSLEGSVLASDAFFPFRDGVDAAASAGVRAIVQPGGSVRDEEVIGAADEHAIAMVFTGRRLFRH